MNVKIFQSIKRFIIINIGLVTMALGYMYFLAPAKLAVGGVIGFAMIMNSYIPNLDTGVLMLILNVILFILAFFFIGFSFGGYTIYCSFALAFIISIMENTIEAKELFPGDLMITLIVGILIQGVGMALVFYQNASTGGTDIVAKIINKYSGIEIGTSLFLADFLITIGAGFAFSPLIGTYAFVGVLLNGIIIDKMIAGFSNKLQIMIISKKHEEILKYIFDELERGATYINAKGAYSNDEKMMLSVILSKREYLRLRTYIKKTDKEAFITVNFVHEVVGKGFKIASL